VRLTLLVLGARSGSCAQDATLRRRLLAESQAVRRLACLPLNFVVPTHHPTSPSSGSLSEFATLPVRGSALAAGYDLSASTDCVVPARGRALVKTDLSMAIPEGCYGRIGTPPLPAAHPAQRRRPTATIYLRVLPQRHAPASPGRA
jgi:hypothetical protein